jgi:hypothetical protein
MILPNRKKGSIQEKFYCIFKYLQYFTAFYSILQLRGEKLQKKEKLSITEKSKRDIRHGCPFWGFCCRAIAAQCDYYRFRFPEPLNYSRSKSFATN